MQGPFLIFPQTVQVQAYEGYGQERELTEQLLLGSTVTENRLKNSQKRLCQLVLQVVRSIYGYAMFQYINRILCKYKIINNIVSMMQNIIMPIIGIAMGREN